MAARSILVTRPTRWQQHGTSSHDEVHLDSSAHTMGDSQPLGQAKDLKKGATPPFSHPKMMFAPSG